MSVAVGEWADECKWQCHTWKDDAETLYGEQYLGSVTFWYVGRGVLRHAVASSKLSGGVACRCTDNDDTARQTVIVPRACVCVCVVRPNSIDWTVNRSIRCDSERERTPEGNCQVNKYLWLWEKKIKIATEFVGYSSRCQMVYILTWHIFARLGHCHCNAEASGANSKKKWFSFSFTIFHPHRTIHPVDGLLFSARCFLFRRIEGEPKCLTRKKQAKTNKQKKNGRMKTRRWKKKRYYFFALFRFMSFRLRM